MKPVLFDIPQNEYGQAIGLPPARPALSRFVSGTISASTEITLNVATTFIRAHAITQSVYLKYGTTPVTASNFDEFIPAGSIVDLAVPEGVTAITVIQRFATATIVIIEK